VKVVYYYIEILIGKYQSGIIISISISSKPVEDGHVPVCRRLKGNINKSLGGDWPRWSG
jgi:hypothetical protein